MLLGTREVWQSTDRTGGGGARTDGSGSRRRAAEFVVHPDDFKQLRAGEAVVWTTLGPAPEQVTVTPGPTLDQGAVDSRSVYQPVRISSLAEALTLDAEQPPTAPRQPRASGSSDDDDPGGDLFRSPS